MLVEGAEVFFNEEKRRPPTRLRHTAPFRSRRFGFRSRRRTHARIPTIASTTTTNENYVEDTCCTVIESTSEVQHLVRCFTSAAFPFKSGNFSCGLSGLVNMFKLMLWKDFSRVTRSLAFNSFTTTPAIR